MWKRWCLVKRWGCAKICTWIVAEDKIFSIPTGLTSHFSCFSDGAGYQGFPPSDHKRLLFFIIGRLINKSGVDSARALVVDRFSIKSLEHWVTGVQRFPVTVLKPQQAIRSMSMQLTRNLLPKVSQRPPLSKDSRLHFRQGFPPLRLSSSNSDLPAD